MRERDRTLSIQKKKLVKTTTFSIVLLSAAIMVLSGAVSAINLNMNTTQMNVNNGGQNQPLAGEDAFAGPAGDVIPGTPTTSDVLEKQAAYPGDTRGTVVYDNTMNYYTLTSNQDDSLYGIDSEGADDFAFWNAGVDVCIQDVHWVGGSWGGSGWVDADWVIKFFEDDGTGNRPGALFAGPFTIINPKKTLLYSSGTTSYWSFSADIPEVCFPGCGEKFWIDIYADHDYPPQYGWAAHYFPIYNHTLVWKAPYFGYPDWVDGITVFGLDLDYAFQLTQKADHDVAVIEKTLGEFCICLPIDVVVTNLGKNDETNVPVHIMITENYAYYDMDDFWFDWIPTSGTGWQPTGSYYQYQEAWAVSFIDTVATFDFSTACKPMVSFFMWHDSYGSGDFIQVTANGVPVGPTFFRNNGFVGWQQHFVPIPKSTTFVGFVGSSDGVFDAWPIYIDDVEVLDMAMDQTKIIPSLPVGGEETVHFEFCPCQWHVLEDVTLIFRIKVCTELPGDEVPANDCITQLDAIYLPFFHDVGEISDTVTKLPGPCLEYTVEGTIENFGQYQECCFKVYKDIWEFIVGPWKTYTLYEQDFQTYTSGWPFYTYGWDRDSTHWRRVYTSILGLGYSYTLRFYYSTDTLLTRARMTIPFSCAGEFELKVQWRDYLSHYSGPYTLGMDYSYDGTNWNTGWEIVNPSSWSARDEECTIPTNGNSNMYLAFRFDGYTWNTNYWYIDNIKVYGREGFLGALDYSDWFCVDTIDPCDTLDITFKNWIPKKPWPDCGKKLYKVCSRTALCDPMDENPANDEFCEFVEVEFFHDVGVEITTPAKGRSTVYAADAYPGYCFCTFDTLTPGSYTVISPYPGPYFAAGGTWWDNKWYVTDYTAATLYTVDTGTGVMTPIGGSGTAYNGISVDPTTGQMYGASSYNLYTIDMGTGTQTMVGSWGTSYLMIDIAFDPSGQLYGHDIVTDSMYLIDKSNGAAALLGATGQACNYAQGMEYDYNDDIMYAMAYTSSGQEFTIDLGTGLFTLVGGFQGGGEIDGDAIPGAAGGVNLPTPDIWIPCGEFEICATVTNFGVFDEVDDPATPCDIEGVTVTWTMYWYYLTDPCEDPEVELVLEGMDTIDLLCGEFKEYCFTYDFQETGVYQLIMNASIPIDCDWDNNEDILNIGVDCCDPISEHTLSPIMPDGENNWYKQEVTAKIEAVDPLCPDPCYGTASGIKEIHYKLNGVETVKADDEVTFKIKAEGVNLVEYWAVDEAGNVEDKFTFEVAIDKTPPTCILSFEKIEDGTVVIKFKADASDATSGINRVEFWTEPAKTTPPFVWEVPWQDSYKTTTFRATAYDSAGNSAYDEIYGGDIPFTKVYVNSQSQVQTLVKQLSQQI